MENINTCEQLLAKVKEICPNWTWITNECYNSPEELNVCRTHGMMDRMVEGEDYSLRYNTETKQATLVASGIENAGSLDEMIEQLEDYYLMDTEESNQ